MRVWSNRVNKIASRETYLLNLLNSTGRITTTEAVEMFGISEATARRMFTKLERSGKIVRNYGGAQLAVSTPNYSYEVREREFRQEKLRIGRLAASLVENGDTIYLDCGTTVIQMALALAERIANGELTHLNVITNSIVNVQALPTMEDCHVILVGGEYNNQRRDFSGPLTERYVAPFHFSKCFLGCEGVNERMGFSSNQFDISSLNTSVLERTDIVYVLMDSSKYNHAGLLSYAPLDRVDIIVSDRLPDDGFAAAIAEAGTRILPVDPEDSHAQK